MEAKELRIGNIVCFFTERSTYLIGIIESINKKTVTIRSSGKSHYVKYVNLKPVLLTEEILLKCGFEKCLVGGVGFDKEKLSVYIGGNTYWNSWKIIEGTPKYVHKLQNLYFSLTGEEIDVSKLFK